MAALWSCGPLRATPLVVSLLLSLEQGAASDGGGGLGEVGHGSEDGDVTFAVSHAPAPQPSPRLEPWSHSDSRSDASVSLTAWKPLPDAGTAPRSLATAWDEVRDQPAGLEALNEAPGLGTASSPQNHTARRAHGRELSGCARATCFGYTCDAWYAADVGNSCYRLETDYGCDCSGCECGGCRTHDCYGYACDYYGEVSQGLATAVGQRLRQPPTSQGTCGELESAYGCDCEGCVCPNDPPKPSPSPTISAQPTSTFIPTPAPTIPCDLNFGGGENSGLKLQCFGRYDYMGTNEETGDPYYAMQGVGDSVFYMYTYGTDGTGRGGTERRQVPIVLTTRVTTNRPQTHRFLDDGSGTEYWLISETLHSNTWLWYGGVTDIRLPVSTIGDFWKTSDTTGERVTEYGVAATCVTPFEPTVAPTTTHEPTTEPVDVQTDAELKAAVADIQDGGSIWIQRTKIELTSYSFTDMMGTTTGSVGLYIPAHLTDISIRGDADTRTSLLGDGTFPLMFIDRVTSISLQDLIFERGYIDMEMGGGEGELKQGNGRGGRGDGA